ncbi:MAG: transcription antitermination factor NusB [Myxococcota bacterium]
MVESISRKNAAGSARWVATQVLFRVAKDQAWATPTLDAAIRSAGLDTRDAGLATAIVYGALRVLPTLDAATDAHIKKPKKVDAWVRAALRVATFQILHLPRVPERAAVHEAVAIVRQKRGKLASFTNAVLRKVRRPKAAAPPSALVVPAWVSSELRRSLGDERATAFLEARTLPPPIDLRAIRDREELIARLPGSKPGRLASAIHVEGQGDPRSWEGYSEGAFAVQEQGAQWVGALVDAQPGERVLDACAGRGGKTAQLAQAVGPSGSLTAVDLHDVRLEQIEAEFERQGLSDVPLETRAVDWTVGTGGFSDGSFDRILVDAPCTGLGTIHRRPEILLRLDPAALKSLAVTQKAILARVAPLLRPGGTLVFAVCSPAAAEGPEVAQSFEPGPLRRDLLEESDDADGILRIGPWWDGCDAYQVVRWRHSGV